MGEENVDRKLVKDLTESLKALTEAVNKLEVTVGKNQEATLGLFALFDEVISNANQLPKKLLEGFAEKMFGTKP